jgi:hypothetical protein
MKHIDKLKDVDPSLIIEHKGGTVLYKNTLYAFGPYVGVFREARTFYINMGAKHKWPLKATEMIIREVYMESVPVHLSDYHKAPIFIDPNDPMLKLVKPKGLLWYGRGMLSLTVLLNVSLIGARQHITWNGTTYALLLMITVMGLVASAICFWSYYIDNEQH